MQSNEERTSLLCRCIKDEENEGFFKQGCSTWERPALEAAVKIHSSIDCNKHNLHYDDFDNDDDDDYNDEAGSHRRRRQLDRRRRAGGGDASAAKLRRRLRQLRPGGESFLRR
jgi:hypothetical protein